MDRFVLRCALCLLSQTGLLRAEPLAEGAPAEPAPLDVRVQGVRAHPAAAPTDPAVSATVIRRERLELPGVQAADVLREAPGVRVTETGGLGAPATASLRGATAAQTPVYFAGVRLNDEVGGAANLADVPLFLVERVEVYRSHAPLVADRLGIGGAIFFEPRRPDGRALRLGALAGGLGARSGWAYASVGDGRHGLLAGIKLEAADNDYSFESDGGTPFNADDDGTLSLRNADSELRSAFLHARERLGAGVELSLFAHHALHEQGAPKLALQPSRAARMESQRELVALRAKIPARAWDGWFELGTSGTRAETVIDDPLGELALGALGVRTPGERVEQSALAAQKLGSGLGLRQVLAVSSERLRRFERSDTAGAQALAARRFALRAALAAEQELGRHWFVDALAALECMDTAEGELSACSRAALVGRAGLGHRQRLFSAFLHVGRYRRPPTLGELYGVSLFTRGNPGLEDEIGEVAELGGRFQLPRPGAPALFWLDAALFARRSRELVKYERAAPGYVVPENIEQSRTLGGELAASVSPTAALELGGSLSALDARDTSAERATVNDALPFLSRLTAVGLIGARHDFDSYPFGVGSASLRYVYQSNRFGDDAGVTLIPEQGSLDLEGAMRWLDDALVSRVRLANALGARRFDVVGFPLPGRTLFVALEASL